MPQPPVAIGRADIARKSSVQTGQARKLAAMEAARHRKRKKGQKFKKRPRPQPSPLRDDGPDQLVPDSLVTQELSVSRMTLWRWSHQPRYASLGFPPPITINGYHYRSRRLLEQWKATALASSRKGRGK